jgi:hypothetical protein
MKNRTTPAYNINGLAQTEDISHLFKKRKRLNLSYHGLSLRSLYDASPLLNTFAVVEAEDSHTKNHRHCLNIGVRGERCTQGVVPRPGG